MKTAVLLATYNSGEFLTAMLNSLLAQTESDFTVYIHDDGSEDDTAEIIRRYIDRHPQRFVAVADSKHRGAKDSFFYLMEKVNADIYFFADADDVWLPDKIKTLRNIMLTRDAQPPVPTAVFCDMFVTDRGLRVTEESFISTLGRDGYHLEYTQLMIDNPAAGCAMCINRPLRNLAIRPEVRRSNISMHDQWLMVLAARFGEVEFVDERLVYYRQHGDNEMGAEGESRAKKVLRNVGDVFSGRFWENKKEFLMAPRKMARELMRYPELSDEDRQMLKEFVGINRKDKLSRMQFYKDHHFTRASGSWWMRLWV